MGNSLDAPITSKASEKFVSSTGLTGGASAMQGWRTSMEDDHILRDIPSATDHVLAAIFDGHGGALTANYLATNLIETLESSPVWKQYLASKNPNLLGEALVDTFLKIDTKMLSGGNELRMQHCGSTAVVAVITPSHIVCANAGDSRCVLGSNGDSKNLSEDHKPQNEIESRRVRAAGGESSLVIESHNQKE